MIVKIFIQFIGNREILSFFIFLNFPTYDNACNGQACSPVWVRVKGTASGTGNGTLKCYLGDSGGPVFASQTAFGLLKKEPRLQVLELDNVMNTITCLLTNFII